MLLFSKYEPRGTGGDAIVHWNCMCGTELDLWARSNWTRTWFNFNMIRVIQFKMHSIQVRIYSNSKLFRRKMVWFFKNDSMIKNLVQKLNSTFMKWRCLSRVETFFVRINLHPSNTEHIYYSQRQRNQPLIVLKISGDIYCAIYLHTFYRWKYR